MPKPLLELEKANANMAKKEEKKVLEKGHWLECQLIFEKIQLIQLI
jgi:hypothetical protein